MIDIVLVDDHQVFVDGLRYMISAQADMRVAGEAAEAHRAYEVVQAARPNLVILDIGLPGVNGVAVIRELLRTYPSCQILILSGHQEEHYVVETLAAGAKGYALKLQTVAEILQAIRDVAEGRTYLAPHVAHVVVKDHLRLRRGERMAEGPIDVLSPREKEVFHLLVSGHSNDSVATNLYISIKTVETHRANILKKLGMHSLVDLVRLAARHQLLPPQ